MQVHKLLQPHFSSAMGAEDDADIGMDITGFLMALPLLSVFHFQEALPDTPERLVEGLLEPQPQALSW